MKNNTLSIILQILPISLLVILVSVLGGFLLWLLWPFVIPKIFPAAVQAGWVAAELDLVTATLAHWMVGVTFGPAASSVKSNSKK